MQIDKGSTIGRYELLAELGRGAMGIVYQARDPKINRFVAVKTISLQGCTPDELQAYRPRLFHEAQAAGRLSHPGIVTMFDVGDGADTLTPYIVMEYVPGRTLEEVLSAKNGKLPLDTALRIVQELAEALDYAHRRGIVHRDIKPSNIIIAEDGHPKITDFGIAKLDIADPSRAGTQGTPAYMSPEQWNHEPIDGRSDLFSLGVILYTLLTGHRPFQGNSILTMSFKVSHHDPVRATALMGLEASPDLDHVTARALAREPAQRYQTGGEMALDLQDLRSGIPPRSRGVNASQSEMKGKPANGSNDTSFCQVAIETVSQRQGASLKLFQFSKPWQQLTIAFSALGFLGLAFGFLWQVIPDGNPRVQNLRRGTVKIASRSIPVSADEQKTAQIAKALPASRRPHGQPGSSMAPSPRPSTKPVFSTLHISVVHHFAFANLSILVDDRLVFQTSLQGAVKKRLIVFRGLQGYLLDSLPIVPGEHQIRARVLSQDGSYDESERVSGSFSPRAEKILRIDFGKDNRDMRLSLQ